MKKLFVLLLAISGFTFGLSNHINRSIESDDVNNVSTNYSLSGSSELPFPIGLA